MSQMDENVEEGTSGIQTETENNSSGEIESVIDQVVGRIERELQETQRRGLPYRSFSISAPYLYQVPDKLTSLNEAAYYPQILFISPLLCFQLNGDPIYRERFDSFRDHKLGYLLTFLKRAEQRASLNDFVKLIEADYGRIWPKLFHLVQKPLLLEFLIENAVFIIELFLRFYDEAVDPDDSIFYDPWKMHDICQDLILVQNQLPFFILRDIYNLAFPRNPTFPSFLELSCHFFSRYCSQNKSIEHVMSPSHWQGSNEYESELMSTPKHFTDLLRTLQLPSIIKHYTVEERLEEGQERGEYLYSAVLLREAGVKFKVDVQSNLCDVTFGRKGELLIPPLRVDELTESFFRNLMAWELGFKYYWGTDICGYVFLMQYLIRSEEDVDLLVRRRIIINQLGDNKAVVTLFKNLCKNIKLERNPYVGLFRKLNAYNEVRRHGWIANLKLQYFSTPWTGAATIAAIILLVLTVVQTICAIISLL